MMVQLHAQAEWYHNVVHELHNTLFNNIQFAIEIHVTS